VTLLTYLLYPQMMLTVWGPLVVFTLAWISRRWRERLSPAAGFWSTLGLLVLPGLMWWVPYLPDLALREALPYRAPIAWGAYNGPLEPTRLQWWLVTVPALIGFGSMLLAGLYGLIEEGAAHWRIRRLSGRREGQVVILDVSEARAFTLGVLHPRVYLSRAVWEGPHRQVILSHERGHARSRHPLWLALARWSRRSLWLWQPAGILLSEVQTWAELMADEAAAKAAGKPALARALQDMLPQPSRAPALSFTSASTLAQRVRQLARPGRPLPIGFALLLALLYLTLLILV